jgi:glutathione synthase/RimK-type ligase-like ATP-grasp enzyme
MTRLLMEMFARGELPNVQAIDIEPVYGYAGRIVYRNGAVRLFRRTNTGINNHGASEIAKDKGYSKYFLAQLGYQTPPGQVFLLPEYLARIDQNDRFHDISHAQIAHIYDYITSTIGYPCFLKPNDGTKGIGVHKCFDAKDVRVALDDYQREPVNLVLAEQMVPYPDYRVLVLNGEVICCYLRRPLAIIGDGHSTIHELLLQRQATLKSSGRRTRINPDDPRIGRKLHKSGWSYATVPQAGEELPLYDISNLSVGGVGEDMSQYIHPHWRTLCTSVVRDMGLIFCGVDIACADIGNPQADYSIFEINSSPGMGNYASIGPAQRAIVYDLYRRVFDMVS